MKNKRNWAIALILTAAAGFVAIQNNGAPEKNVDTTAPPPAAASAYNDCAYQWAYHDAPELTDKVGAMIRELDPGAEIHASLFGEDCVYADGRKDFLVRETDFYVRLSVTDLTNEELMGNWMADVMPLLAGIPDEEIPGDYGFVEFWFEKNDGGHITLRVPFQRYVNEGRGKRGVELFRLFSSPIPF